MRYPDPSVSVAAGTSRQGVMDKIGNFGSCASTATRIPAMRRGWTNSFKPIRTTRRNRLRCSPPDCNRSIKVLPTALLIPQNISTSRSRHLRNLRRDPKTRGREGRKEGRPAARRQNAGNPVDVGPHPVIPRRADKRRRVGLPASENRLLPRGIVPSPRDSGGQTGNPGAGR